MREITDLPPVVLPEGSGLQHVRAGDAGRRVAAHRAGWSDFGSRVPTESYAPLMDVYPYRHETDLVVVAPNNQWVA